MKLVQILARELKKWPKAAYVAVQDDDLDKTIWFLKKDHEELKFIGGEWRCESWFDILVSRPSALSDDHATAIVTSEMWQAERDKLKPKKTKADGWIRHRGGRCPVSARGIQIDIRRRNGVILENVSPQGLWKHEGDAFDVMAWRAHKPAEQPVEADIYADDTGPAVAPVVVTYSDADGPLVWRDRIREIDRTVEALEEERVSLIQRLEGEGFKLIDQVNAKIAEAAQAHEDMSDWRNWKVGDLVECLHDSVGGTYRKGSVHEIEFIDGEKIGTVTDSVGDVGNSWTYAHFKFHSRPST